jgi:hypothetical protein
LRIVPRWCDASEGVQQWSQLNEDELSNDEGRARGEEKSGICNKDDVLDPTKVFSPKFQELAQLERGIAEL